MTDHDDRDDRTWFRTHLDPVVDGPAPDAAWAAIAARTGHDGNPIGDDPVDDRPADGHLATLGTPSARARSRWLLAAAAVLIAAALTGALAVRSRPDHDRLRAGDPGSAAFLVPVDLPPGWKVASVTVDEHPNWSRACPCERWLWVDGRGGHLSLTVEDASTDFDAVPGTPVDLGHAVTGSIVDGQDGFLFWRHQGRDHRLFAAGTDDTGLTAAARALVAAPGDAPTGWSLDSHARGNPRTTAGRSITLQVRTKADGTSLAVQLTPPWSAPRAFNIEYPTMHLLDLPEGPALRTPDRWGAEGYVEGLFDTAHVHVGWGELPYQGHPNGRRAPGLDAYETMLRHLRPASASEWRRFLDGVDGPVSPRLRHVDSLAAVFDPDPTSTPATTTNPTTTTAVETTTTTTPTKVTSGPGTSRPNDTTASSFTPLDGIEIRLELADDTIGMDPVAATLVYRNTTDQDVELTECTRLKTTWALVPESEPDAPLPDHAIIDCYRSGRPDLAAGATLRVPLEWSSGQGFVARSWGRDRNGFDSYAGTLPGGRYLAVVDVPGRGSTVRVQVPVTVAQPACPMSDELALRWRDRPVGAATAEAAAAGLHVVVVSDEQGAHAITKELDCSRLKASVGGGRIYDYTLG